MVYVGKLVKPPDCESGDLRVQVSSYTPLIDAEFLGYDLSCGFHFSLLAQGLEVSEEQKSSWAEDSKLRILLPLVQLIAAHFVPKLNANTLFDSCQDAEFCLKCMMALQKLYPNLWEGDKAVFEIVGLYKVD